jgi:hypothetical protein
MGLSLSNNNSSTGPKFRKKKMSRIKNGPVLWIDFTDRRTVYTDDMNTNANHGDYIYAVSNKAFDKRFGKANNAALGTGLKQATSNKRPRWTANVDLPYATFINTPDTNSLFANELVGNVGNTLLSQSRLEGDALTFFIVFNLVNSSATCNIFSMKAGDGAGGQDPIIFQIPTDQKVKMFIGDQSDKSGTVLLDSNSTIVSNALQLWTVRLQTGGASVMRKNGGPSIGNGVSKDHTYAFDINNNHLIEIGSHVNGLKMYEILVFNEVLPDKEMFEVERQLKQKYNL